jgi:membrane fusion protein, multidrug efflux system
MFWKRDPLAPTASSTAATVSAVPSKRKTVIKIGLVVLLLAAAIAGLIGWRTGSAKKEEKPKVDPVFEFAPSDLVEAQPRELGNLIPVSGTLRPVTQAVVKSKVAAEVARLHVQEGIRVEAGAALISLDTADLRARFESQSAAVAEMKARLDLAKKNEANNKQLLSRNFISQNAFDAVSNTVEVATANLRAAEAQAAISQRALNDATIRAPFGGVIARRMVNVGEKVSPDMPVMQVVDLSRMELEAMVPVAEIPGVKIGQELSFTVDGFGDRAFRGKVERINPSAESGSRSIAIFVTLPNADQSLKGGMFANGKLAAASRAPVMSVPIAALREEGGQTFLFVLKGDTIARNPITVGNKNIDKGLAEIREGVVTGEKVITVKAEGMKAGSKASVKSATSAPTPPVTAAAAKASS